MKGHRSLTATLMVNAPSALELMGTNLQAPNSKARLNFLAGDNFCHSEQCPKPKPIPMSNMLRKRILHEGP